MSITKENNQFGEKEVMWKAANAPKDGEKLPEQPDHAENDKVSVKVYEGGKEVLKPGLLVNTSKPNDTKTGFVYQIKLNDKKEVKLFEKGRYFTKDEVIAEDD